MVHTLVDTLDEEELFLTLQAELQIVNGTDCVVAPKSKNCNYIRIHNLKTRIIDLHPEWNINTIAAILDGNVINGMPKDQVRTSMGLPKDVSIEIESGGACEQWVYGDEKSLRFEGDELVGFGNVGNY